MSEAKKTYRGYTESNDSPSKARTINCNASQRPLPKLVSDPYRDYNEYFDGSLALNSEEILTAYDTDFVKIGRNRTALKGLSPRFDIPKQKVIPFDRRSESNKSLRSIGSQKSLPSIRFLLIEIIKSSGEKSKKLLNFFAEIVKAKLARVALLVVFMFILIFGPSMILHSLSNSAVSTPSGSPAVITVQNGQSIQSIAETFDPTNPQSIVQQIENQTGSATIYPGEKIVIKK
jgi:LysM repeat protein